MLKSWAIFTCFGVPAIWIGLAYAFAFPWIALGVIVAIVAVLAFMVWRLWDSEQQPFRDALAVDDAEAEAKARKAALVDAWRHDDKAIEAGWPMHKPVAKYVRHPSGVGLTLNRD